MADAAGFWQKLSSQGKFCFLFLIANIVFLLISMGLTAWSVSDYDMFIKFFQQYESTDGFGIGSGNAVPTLGGSASSWLLPSYTLGDDPSLSTMTEEGSRSSTLEIDQISRSYSTFTSTFTTTRTSFSVDPASYTATSYTTWTRPNGNPYMTFTYYLGGERSAYTTLTSTGTRLARTTLAKRDYTATSISSSSSSSVATPATTPSQMKEQSLPQSMPTAAPWAPSAAAAVPYEQKMMMVVQDPDQRSSSLQRKLYRRQSLTGINLQQYLDAARVLLALNSVILVIILLQLILCIAYLVLFLTTHSKKTDEQVDSGHTKFSTYTKWFVILASILCFLLLVFAIASTAYSRTMFRGTGAGNVALFIFFWIVTAILGFVLVANVYQLKQKKADTSRGEVASSPKKEEGTPTAVASEG